MYKVKENRTNAIQYSRVVVFADDEEAASSCVHYRSVPGFAIIDQSNRTSLCGTKITNTHGDCVTDAPCSKREDDHFRLSTPLVLL